MSGHETYETPEKPSIVPYNFGIKYFNKKEHSNVTLVLRDKTNILANSVILSLNSPVFDRLTTDLALKTVEMDDFEEGAVCLFIESFYTGKMEKIKEQNFRDLNKMSKVFEVLWISVICRDYFSTLDTD